MLSKKCSLQIDPMPWHISYASVVGILLLLYLAGNTCLDIAYRMSQVARFTFSHKHSHKQALKLMGRYLLKTHDKGLILEPTRTLDIGAYPGADFAGLYGYEDSLDPV